MFKKNERVNRGSSPLGDNFNPWGQSSPLGANFTPWGYNFAPGGEVKNWPLSQLCIILQKEKKEFPKSY
jgi:hypothetical protein